MSAGDYADEIKEQTLASDVQLTSQRERSKDCIEPGSLFNAKYRVVKLLGQGGMSSVYQVEDIMLKRMVALKILHPKSLGSDNSILRFQQEARAASMLKHSGIVTIHEFGVSPDGQPFLVMDYVEGVSLAEEIAGGPLSLARMIGIVSDVCDALGEAHSRGIVHRDIKPSNIMLVRKKDGGDSVKIVDFGIAKLALDDVDQVALTQTGEVFGSPLYMSPEQCQGLKVDARADIYALGCLLYEGLCGHPPFTGSNTLATMQQHINAEPVALTEIREADSKQISQMKKILQGLLAKNPEHRYQDLQALKQDLAEVLAGRSVKTNVYRGQKQKSTKLIALVALLAVIGVGWFQLQTGWHERSRSILVKPTVTAATPPVILSEEQQRRRWSVEDIAGQKDFDHGGLQSARKHFLTALDEANHYRGQDKEQIRAIACNELCDLTIVTHDDSANLLYSMEEKLLQDIMLQDKVRQMTPILRQLRKAIERKGKISDAERAQLDELIAHADAFAVNCQEDGYFDMQQEFSKTILEACERTHNSLQAARTEINIGDLLIEHNYERKPAELLLKLGLELRKKYLPPFDPDLGQAFYVLGAAQRRWHDRDCEKNLTSAYRIYSRAYGPASTFTGNVALALAQYYKQKNDKVQMQHYAKIAVQNLENVGSTYPRYDGILADLGQSYLCLDMVPEACSTFQRLVDHEERMVSRAHLAEDLSSLIAVKVAQGKIEEARALAARRNAIDKRSDLLRRYLLPKTLASFKQVSLLAPTQ